MWNRTIRVSFVLAFLFLSKAGLGIEVSIDVTGETSRQLPNQYPDHLSTSTVKATASSPPNNGLQWLIEIEQDINDSASTLSFTQASLFNRVDDTNSQAIWQLGLYPLPIGHLNIEGNDLFLSTPFFHSRMFSSEQATDSGVHVGWKYHRIETLGGVYQGDTLPSPSGDQVRPSVLPHLFKIAWVGETLSLNTTYYSEKLSFRPRKNIVGLGGQFMRGSWEILSEVWHEYRSQDLNEDQQSLGSYIFVEYHLKQWKLGLRWDNYTILNLKDAWNDSVANNIQNWSPSLRFLWNDQIHIHLEGKSQIENWGSRNQQIDQGVFFKASFNLEAGANLSTLKALN